MNSSTWAGNTRAVAPPWEPQHRCDFACRSCYMGKTANRTPALSLSAVKEQILTLRNWLGPGGNLQLTDGELTLLEDPDLLELVPFALSQELIPMLMAHGDALPREPQRLNALVRGGLTELSIHADSTQRGRRDSRFRFATSKSTLMELRDEFVELIRGLRRLPDGVDPLRLEPERPLARVVLVLPI